jgi:hypothetical protein
MVQEGKVASVLSPTPSLPLHRHIPALAFFSSLVSPSFFMEKNMGPSSASHSGSTAVTHCMYSLDVITCTGRGGKRSEQQAAPLP